MAGGRNGSWSKSSGSRVFRFLRLGLIFLAAAFVMILIWTATEIYRFSMKDFSLPNARYAIVLGAATYGAQPSPVFRQRIHHAIELFNQGKIETIIFTGGPGNPPQAEVAKALALAAGVPEGRILLETESTTTRENLQRTAVKYPEIARSSILIISDPLHLKRAMLIARDLSLDAYPAPTPTTQFRSGISRGKFLFRETFAYLKYRFIRLL